jgi:hypothetical protein
MKKITELREKYKADLPMIYEKLGDMIHNVKVRFSLFLSFFSFLLTPIRTKEVHDPSLRTERRYKAKIKRH